MNVQQEEQLVCAFSKEIKATFFTRIPSTQWKVECITANYWLFGVKNEFVETYPYLYSLHFDWKNRLVTLRLEQEVMKSTYLFPHVYHRFLHFLKERHYDVCVRNDNFALKSSLYKPKQIPLHATGEGAKQVLALLEELHNQIDNGAFYFWKEPQTIHFSTPRILHWYQSVQFVISEKERDSQGTIEINGQSIQDTQQIQIYCQQVKAELQFIQQKEREIIDYLAALNKKSYYDPFSESLTIFKKTIPFSIKLIIHEERGWTYRYAVRFGSETKQSSSLDTLIEEVKKDIYEYILQDRLRAVVEGRI